MSRTTVSQPVSKIKRTSSPTVHMLRYDTNTFTFMPLHRWDAKSKTKAGARKDIGKAPRDADWTGRKYNSAAVRDNALADGHNMGIRLTDEQLVIDVDPRNGGKTGFNTLMFDLGLDEDEWPRVITGSGGWHCYMRKPADILVRDTLGDYQDGENKYPGVEFKTKGRQVVAAGSRHPNGEFYRWDDSKPNIKDGLPKAPTVLLTLITRPPRSAVNGGGQYTQEQISKALAKLDVRDFNDNDSWIQLMMAVHHATNGDARMEFIDWSIGDPDFEKEADWIGRRWDSLHTDKPGAITFRTLNRILGKAGASGAMAPNEVGDDFDDDKPLVPEGNGFDDWNPDDESHPAQPLEVFDRGLKVNKQAIAADTFKNTLAALRATGLRPAFNELSKNVEFIGHVPWDVAKFGRTLDDKVLTAVRLFLIQQYQGNDFDPSLKNLNESIDSLAYSNRFNPVLDYLNSLEWDGTRRVARLFGDYLNCGVDAYTMGVSTAFMVGAVARIRRPGCKFDTMPVIKGPQGFNKSTALRRLFGSNYYSDANLGPLTNKDASMKLRGLWLFEFSEIESLRKHEVNVLKSFISLQMDRQRDPYERRVSDVPRSTVFAATVNEGGYLGDATGGRRFWPLELQGRINVAKIETDRDQLWAEAVRLEADGVSRVLPAKLWSVAAEHQDAETVEDPWTDTLRECLDRRAALALDAVLTEIDPDDDFATPPPHADKVHTCELFDALGIADKDQTRSQTGRLRSVMESRLGWRHKKGIRINDAVKAGYERL